MKNKHSGFISVTCVLILFLLVHTPLLKADVPPDQQAEVEYLLNRIKTSTCAMERNGVRGTGEMAHKHIQFKYDYYRDDIQTTEDFVRLAATKSVLSGKYYMIYCDNQPGMKLGDWLLQELARYRSR